MSINNSDSAHNTLAARGNTPADALMRTARFRRVDAPEIVGRSLATPDDIVTVLTTDAKGRKCIRPSVKALISEARFMGDFACFHLGVRLRDECLDWYRFDPQGLAQLLERPGGDWMEVADKLLELTKRKPAAKRSEKEAPGLPL